MTTSVLQGGTTTLLAQIAEYAGGPPQDLTGVTIAIKSADGAITVLPATSTGVAHPATGTYTYVWAVNVSQAPGGYLITWSGTDSGGHTVTATEIVTVLTIPTYAAQLAAARRYDRVPYQATDATGNPIPGALFSLWDGPEGGAGARQVTNVTTPGGTPIPGGVLVGDVRGYAPGFLDLDKTPNLYIIGSATGVIDGVDPVLIEPSDTDDRVIAIEALISGPSGMDERITALEQATTGGGAAGTITGLLPGVFSVRDYGAPADGMSDDQPGIQAACDAAVAAGGGVVVIPPGRYRCGTNISPGADTVIWAYGAYIKAVGNTGLLRNFQSGDSFTGYNGRSRIRVYGGIWDGNAGNGTGGTTTAEVDVFNFIHGRDIIVRDVTVRNVSSAHGVEFNAVDGGRVLDSRFEGFRDNSVGGARYFSEAIQIDCAVSGAASIGAFDGTPSKNILVSGCYAGPAIDGSGNGTFGKLAGSHSVAAGQPYENIRIVGNVVDGALNVGVGAWAWNHSVIANNVIRSTAAHGIAVRIPDPVADGITISATDITITGNVIDTAADEGIRVAGYAGSLLRNVVLAGNTIRTVSNTGIDVQYCPGADVTGNVVNAVGAGAGTDGIRAVVCDRIVINGNTVDGVTANHGVNVQGCFMPSAVGNAIANTGGYGIIYAPTAGGTNTTDGNISANTIYNVDVAGNGVAGIRLSTNATACWVQGNQFRKGTGGATAAVSNGQSTTTIIVNNDFSGNGFTTSNWAAFTGTPTGTAKTAYGGAFASSVSSAGSNFI